MGSDERWWGESRREAERDSQVAARSDGVRQGQIKRARYERRVK